MATGSGKTFTAITAAYRLIKFAEAKRILFLVDHTNLGKQAEKEFQQYTTPDDGRKFTELYTVQRLASNKVDSVAKVVITTIQRLYSMLKGEEDIDPGVEEVSLFQASAALPTEPVGVVYNPAIPPEFFDLVIVDECHRVQAAPSSRTTAGPESVFAAAAADTAIHGMVNIGIRSVSMVYTPPAHITTSAATVASKRGRGQ